MMSSKQVPTGALQFAVDSPSVEQAESANGVTLHPFKMKARTGGVADHWYWGRVVHDFGGMRVAEKIPVDYCHDYEEPIGYVDKIDTSSGDLMLQGVLTSVKDDDRAAEIAAKARAGVPYQASITMGSDLVYEELSEGATAVVNGREVQGPVTIFRQWSLRGVAVCVYGSDPMTNVEFNRRNTTEVEVRKFVQKEAVQMSDQTVAENVPGTPEAAQQEAPVSGREFLDAFGDLGGRWFAEGKSFAECQKLFIADLQAKLDEAKRELAARNDELAKLKAVFMAQAGGQPVSFSSADAASPRGEARPVSRLDRFAASLVFSRNK